MHGKTLTRTYRVDGMSCTGCEDKLERVLNRLSVVRSSRADYEGGTVEVTFDDAVGAEKRILEAMEKAGYFPDAWESLGADSVLEAPRRSAPAATPPPAAPARRPAAAAPSAPTGRRLTALQFAGIVVAVLAVVLVVNAVGGFSFLPEITSTMGFGMLFLVGILTSVHCVGMCGGIVLSQCLPADPDDGTTPAAEASAASTLRPGLLYNAGRVVSYTVVGGIAGAIGSAVSFSGAARGAIAVVAGLVMLLMGVQMLGLFPGLSRFLPRMPRALRRRADQAKRGRGPFLVGLLNGLMPCGPLQAMQVYALGTGSALLGAASMLFFSLGTVPLLLGLGAASAALGRRFTSRMMKVGAVVVLALGIVMIGRGFTLSGLQPIGASGQDVPGAQGIVSVVEDGVQTVTTTLSAAGYPAFTVQTGVPVRWDLKVPAGTLTGCNRTVVVPAYGIERALEVGDNWIEFTPTATGTVPFSCWMGMIDSSIHVVAAGTPTAQG